MNLFTTYSEEETKFLLSLINKTFPNKTIPILSGVDIEKLTNFYTKDFQKRDLIKEYDFIVVNSGKLGVIKNAKIVKILKEGDIFGFLKVFLNEDYTLLVLEKSDITFFSLGEDIKIRDNLFKYLINKLKNKVII